MILFPDDGPAALPIVPTVGRTAWDFFSDHSTSTVLIAVAASLALLVIVIIVFASLSYARASREGRPFTVFGVVSIGGEIRSAAQQAASANPSDKAPSHSNLAKAGMLMSRVVPHIVAARGDAEAIERERDVLGFLHAQTTQGKGVIRRASILRTVPAGADVLMKFHVGYPADAFTYKAEFSRQVYWDDQKGLCWKAALAAQALQKTGRAKNRERPTVLAIADVESDAQFLRLEEDDPFKSLLIAPILSVVEPFSDIFGVICLDSEQIDYYDEQDKEVMAIAALQLSVAWSIKAQGS